MSTSIPEQLFDLRIVERHIQEGKVTQADYDAFLASIEDSAGNVEQSNVSLVTHHRARVTRAEVPEEEEG